MSWAYINTATWQTDYKIACKFTNGSSGLFNLKPYKNYGGVFDSLQDENYARNFQLRDGVLTWGNGELDLSPETVYHQVTGEPLPDWMQ